VSVAGRVILRPGSVGMVEPGEGQPTTWKFTQCFGDKGDVEDITEGMIDFWDRCIISDANLETSRFRHELTRLYEADIISTVEFDQTGNYLATGDKGGRVVLFERNDTVRIAASSRDLPRMRSF
jgi:serine/threonine-protein phosphatase 2A regulatory subunit B